MAPPAQPSLWLVAAASLLAVPAASQEGSGGGGPGGGGPGGGMTMGWDEQLDDKLGNCGYGETQEFTCQDYRVIMSGYGARLSQALSCLDYNKFVSPGEYVRVNNLTELFGPKHQVKVEVSFKKVLDLDESAHVLHLDFLMYVYWSEPRFASPPVDDEGRPCFDPQDPGYFDLDTATFENHIWLPPIELDDLVEMEVRDSFRSGKGYQLYEDGFIVSYGRYEAKIDCSMNFASFPFDEHVCPFELYLGKGNQTEISFDWSRSVEERTDVEELYVPNFKLRLRTSDAFTHHNEFDNQFTDGVAAEFKFSRIFTIHLMHTFFPSIMIALSSVLSVFVPSDLVPGRMGLCITAFLSMISLFNGARSDWPVTSYMKAIDFWTGGCYVTVFCALIEYCVVLYLTKMADWERKVRKHKKRQFKDKSKVAPYEKQPEKVFDVNGELIRKKEVIASMIELGARILLPSFFTLFMLIFFMAHIV